MTALEKFTALMIGLAAAYRKTNNNKALASHLKQLLTDDLRPIALALNMNRKTVDACIAAISASKVGNNGEPTTKYATLLKNLYLEIRPNLTKFYQSTLSNEQANKILKPAISLFVFNPDVAPKKEAALDKELPNVKDKFIKSLFIAKKSDLPKQQDAIAEIKMLVKKWTGKPGLTLDRDTAEKIKKKDPERFKHFQQLNKSANDAYKVIVRHLVREAGKDLPVKDIVAGLKVNGATEKHPYTQFVNMPLLVGEDGFLRTKAGNRMKVLPPLGSEVRYNKDYDANKDDKYVMQYRPPNTTLAPGKWKAIYTQRLLRSRRDHRFTKVNDNISKVPRQRAKWVSDLSSKNVSDRLCATITELLYQFAARIGGKGETKGETTFGLSTLQIKHIKKTGGGWTISYPGKDGVKQTHVVNSKLKEFSSINKTLEAITKDKKPNDLLWSYHGKVVGSASVRAYLKSKGVTVNPHKFRHIRGSVLMQSLLDKAKIPDNATQPQVEKIVKELAIKVGELLGHVSGAKPTANTSIQNYIMPSVFTKFFTSKDLRVPQWVPASGDA